MAGVSVELALAVSSCKLQRRGKIVLDMSRERRSHQKRGGTAAGGRLRRSPTSFPLLDALARRPLTHEECEELRHIVVDDFLERGPCKDDSPTPTPITWTPCPGGEFESGDFACQIRAWYRSGGHGVQDGAAAGI